MIPGNQGEPNAQTSSGRRGDDLGRICHNPGPAFAGPFTEGTVLPNYTVVSVGPNASVKINSGPITGNVLLGDGTDATSSGGNNGQITGHVDDSGTVNGDNLANLQFPPTIHTVNRRDASVFRRWCSVQRSGRPHGHTDLHDHQRHADHYRQWRVERHRCRLAPEPEADD